jgi:hypothetical protein
MTESADAVPEGFYLASDIQYLEVCLLAGLCQKFELAKE